MCIRERRSGTCAQLRRPRDRGRRRTVRLGGRPRPARAAHAGGDPRGKRSPHRIMAALLRQPAPVLAGGIQLDAGDAIPRCAGSLPGPRRGSRLPRALRCAARRGDPDQHPRADDPAGRQGVHRRDRGRAGVARVRHRGRERIVRQPLPPELPGREGLHRRAFPRRRLSQTGAVRRPAGDRRRSGRLRRPGRQRTRVGRDGHACHPPPCAVHPPTAGRRGHPLLAARDRL